MSRSVDDWIPALRHEAAVMDQRWGRNPTSELLREVANHLESSQEEPEEPVKETPKPKTTTRKTRTTKAKDASNE